MRELFETTRVNNMELSNRFIRSATWEALATPDGYATKKLTQLLVGLANGGVGMIITGHAYVSEEGQASPFQLGIYSDSHIALLKEMTTAVHAAGARIVAQISHAGCMAFPELTGEPPLGPSAGPSVLELDGRPSCTEMVEDDFRRLRQAFGRAAARAQEAEFDGIELHAAHGYLLSQFLSPVFNKRRDNYGGALEGRARLLLEVVREVRDAVGSRFAVIVKINSEDFMEGGFTTEEMVTVSAMLKQSGIDAIEMSGGTFYSHPYIPTRTGKTARVEGEAYYLEAARRYKEKIDLPLILVGGIRSYAIAQKLVADGTTDYIALCRPLIAEPGLINRWKSGDRERAFCKSDNLCSLTNRWKSGGMDEIGPGERGLCCVTKQRLGRQGAEGSGLSK